MAWGGTASGEFPSFGASFGAVFPADRLSSQEDELGASLNPGPAVGVYGRFKPLESVPRLSPEVMMEFALFQSSEDPRLRLTYVPLQVAGIWDAGRQAGMGLQLRVGMGPSFISANRGEDRSLVAAAGSLGGRLETGFRNLDCALEAGLEVLFKGDPQSLLRFRILLFTR